MSDMRLKIGIVICASAAAICRAGAQTPQPRSFEAIAVSPTEIRCFWLPADGVEKYRLMRDGQPIAELPAAAQAYSDSGLRPNETHRYAIQGVAGSAASAPISYTERTFAEIPASRRPGTPAELSYDVVVVQASSGGVAAAYEAARRGLKVALVEPTTRIGGMPSNGLSATDLRRAEHASGFFTLFRDRVRALYAREGVTANGLEYEPRVAHQAMKSLLYESPNVTLYRLARMSKVFTAGSRRVRALRAEEVTRQGTPTGRKFDLAAKVFIDATDCGDLAAWAGAPYRIGREPKTAEEPHNGVIYYDRKNDRALPGSTGNGDRRIQAFSYLLTVKDYGPGADKTIPMPPGYRKEDFVHTPAWLESWAVTSGKMPNSKYELNQHPQGGDIQGINYGYPEAGYPERLRLERLHRDKVLGYLYYIQTEQGQKQVGLPDDEYRDTGGFPPLLYVREGRRILGEQLPTEKDITKTADRLHPDSIGLGDYPMDSHAVRPKTDWSTPDMGEGEWWLYKYTPPHELPIGVIVPKALDNVFVTTAVSSTHVSFGTYRLEPVRMAFGQASAIAAELAIRYRLPGRQIPARQIQDQLLPHFANPYGDTAVMLTYLSDIKPNNPNYRAIHYLASRGFRTSGETFRPSAGTTRPELIGWLKLLADRSAPEATAPLPSVRPLRSYFGLPANRQALSIPAAAGSPEQPVTRRELAIRLAALLPARPLTAPYRYSDIDDPQLRSAVHQLAQYSIDSILWDSWSAFAPDGSLRFNPDAPIRHDQTFQALYLAQIGFGPSFDDHPMDAGKGRELPEPPCETVVP